VFDALTDFIVFCRVERRLAELTCVSRTSFDGGVDLPLVWWSRVFRVLASARRQNAREVSISSASSGR
jgi:hypothetical protein